MRAAYLLVEAKLHVIRLAYATYKQLAAGGDHAVRWSLSGPWRARRSS
jgi:hypothetical protein